MRKLIIFMTLFFAAYNAANAYTVDQKILDAPLKTLSGKTIKLSQFKGNKPVYLKFWATWCRPCRKQMPHLQHTFNEYGDSIQVISINLGINDNLSAIMATKQEFGLTLPIVIDNSGALAQAFGLVGTPYHILLDKDANVVHKGHEASEELDRKIKLLTTRVSTVLPNVSSPSQAGNPLMLASKSKEISALFFMATWCDWYLKESRPLMSSNCVKAQNIVNMLSEKFSQLNWVGVASRLWTGEKELEKYRGKFHIKHSLIIDDTNEEFLNYQVKDFPTLVLVKNGEEVFRIKDFSDAREIIKKIEKSINNEKM